MLQNKPILHKQLSRSLCFNFMHRVMHGSQEYQRIQMKIINVVTSSLLLIFQKIFCKFPEILNFEKIHNPSCPMVQSFGCHWSMALSSLTLTPADKNNIYSFIVWSRHKMLIM